MQIWGLLRSDDSCHGSVIESDKSEGKSEDKEKKKEQLRHILTEDAGEYLWGGGVRCTEFYYSA